MADADFNVKAIISAQTSQFEKGMKNAQSSLQKTSKSIEGVSKLLKGAFSVIGIGASLKAVTSFGKECVRAADSANKSFKILNNTLKATEATSWTSSEEMVKMSKEIAHSTNYTVGEIQDMQSVLLGFRNITGETFREASDAITDMATVMGMDLKSAVQTVGKALDDPVKGLDSLRRQGFAFTEEQKAELEVLVRNGEQLKAQKIILDELNTTYGGAAKAAQSAFDKQKDSVIEFKETLGNQLMPVMNKFAEDSATTFNRLTNFVKKMDFTEIAATIEYTVDIVKEYLSLFYENFKELFRGLGIEIESSEGFFETWKKNLYNILNAIYEQMQLSFGFIKALINGDWKLAWEYAKIYVLEVCKKILDGLDNLLGKMPNLVNGAIKGLNAYYEAQNKVLIDFFHLPEKYFKVQPIALYNGENLIDTKSIQEEIDKATKYIEEATGKQVTINLTGLEEIDNKRKEYQKNAEEGEIHLTSTTEVQVEKRTSLFSQESGNIIASWKKVVEDLKNKTKDWTGVITSVLSEASNAFGETFTMMGENLVGAGHGYEDFAAVALNSLAQVLQSLGAQLAALAAVKAMAYSYGEAAVALAASSAAFVASGVASGMAKQLSAVGTSADKAGKSLKYFNDRLREIKEGLTNTTRNLVYNVTQLRSLSRQADKAAEEKLKQYEIERDRIQAEVDSLEEELKNKYSEIGQQMRLAKLQSLTALRNKYLAEYNELVEKSNELNAESNKVLRETLQAYNAQILNNKNTIESYKELYTVTYKISEFLKAAKSFDISYLIQNFMQMPELMQYYQVVLLEQKDNIQKTLMSVYESLSKTGQTIGESIIDSLVNGATKSDFLISMKDYIRENLLKLAVYTESFQDKLAEIGVKLNSALLGGGSIKDVRKELEDLWDTASKQAKQAEAIIAEAFGDLNKVVDNTIDNFDDEIEEKLTKFEQLVKNFKETVSDLGGDIATNLVDGISSGLSQSDFLDNMKKWIRKMLVQSVVYTESMKAEIEAIGQAITKGLSEGFTETTFHEIKRDLSWVFNEANKTIGNIDDILNSVFGGGYATGTNNATSGIHLVGEAGPELVRFRGGEQVLNAGNTNKALSGMSGTTINQNVTFNNLQDTTAFNMMQQLRAYNRQMAINGVI